MRTYPKFLKKTPTFFGLDFIDIALIMASLFLAMIFNLSPFTALIIGALMIGVSKYVRKNFDLTALFIARKENNDDSF